MNHSKSLNKTFALLITSLMLISLSQSASAEVYSLDKAVKQAIVTSFVKAANDPRSIVGAQITKINEETKDGRNSDGTIHLPVKADDLQLVVIEGEELHVPWHYASKENGFCSTDTNPVTVRLFLTQIIGVHYATDYSTTQFEVNAHETLKAKILKDGEGVYCEDLQQNEDPKAFGPVKTSIAVGEFSVVAQKE